jgi:uncharacterized membrane-anchored protein YitT (DUF2179 family)
MNILKVKLTKNEMIMQLVTLFIAAFAVALGLNFFLIPGSIMTGSLSGIAQILHAILPYQVDTGFLILILNIPMMLLGFVKLGRGATILSALSIVAQSIFTIILPIVEISHNPLMNAIFGGLLLGFAAGVSLKYGYTSGGMDILSLVLSKTTGHTVGNYMLALNGVIILIAGALFSWESALYTIISIYVTTQVVDMIHTSHQKVTAFIVTTNPQPIIDELSNQLVRGMTLLPSVGAYSKAEGQTIMMVITRYELYVLEKIVKEADAHSFVNIVPTSSLIGRFASEDEQKVYRETGEFPAHKQHK